MDCARPSSLAEEQSHTLALLASSIEDGIKALVAWDMAAFGKAVERQGELCVELTAVAEPCFYNDNDDLRRTRELARQYRFLLRHSSQWARSMRAILLAGGHNPDAACATLHLRG